MRRFWVLAACLVLGCASESVQTGTVATQAHPSLHMFDTALSSDAMQLTDMQIVAVTAARAPLVQAIARLDGARRAYAEGLAGALESGKVDDAALALASTDVNKAVDAFIPVEATAKRTLYEALDPRQQRALGPWPELTPTRVDLALDRAALVDALKLDAEARAKLVCRLRAGGTLR